MSVTSGSGTHLRSNGWLLNSVIWKMAKRSALLGIVPQCVHPAADSRVFFHHGNPHAALGCLHRGTFTTRAGADHNDIEFGFFTFLWVHASIASLVGEVPEAAR